jgi:MFS family permease
MYMVGMMIGSFVCGLIADKIGRKKTLIASALLSSTASLVGAWMPEFISYTITRCALGRKGTLELAQCSGWSLPSESRGFT